MGEWWIWLIAFVIIGLIFTLFPGLVQGFYKIKYNTKYSNYYSCKLADELVREQYRQRGIKEKQKQEILNKAKSSKVELNKAEEKGEQNGKD